MNLCNAAMGIRSLQASTFCWIAAVFVALSINSAETSEPTDDSIRFLVLKPLGSQTEARLDQFRFPYDFWSSASLEALGNLQRPPIGRSSGGGGKLPERNQAVGTSTIAMAQAEEKLEALNNKFETLPPDLQDEILDEMDFAEKDCQGKNIFSSFYNCSCMGEEFFNYRVENGFTENKYSLTGKLAPKCVDTENIFIKSLEYYASSIRSRSKTIRDLPADGKEKQARCFALTMVKNLQQNHAQALGILRE